MAREKSLQNQQEELLKKAQSHPGVATVMEVYGSHLEIISKAYDLQLHQYNYSTSTYATGANG